MQKTELTRRLQASAVPEGTRTASRDVAPRKWAVQKAERMGLLAILIVLVCVLALFLAIVTHDLMTTTLAKLWAM